MAIEYKICCNTVAIWTFWKMVLSGNKTFQVYPPRLVVDLEDDCISADDTIEMGNYNCPVLLIASDRLVMPSDSTVTIYGKRIEQFMKSNFSYVGLNDDTFPVMIPFAVLIHTLMHEYMHHFVAVKRYTNYMKEFQVCNRSQYAAGIDDIYRIFMSNYQLSERGELADEMETENKVLKRYYKVLYNISKEVHEKSADDSFADYEKMSFLMYQYFANVSHERLGCKFPKDCMIRTIDGCCEEIEKAICDSIENHRARKIVMI